MARPKPAVPPPRRLAITITPEARAALYRLSEVSGLAAASFAANVVNDAVPVFEAMTKAFEVAKISPEKASQEMASALQEAMVRGAQQHLRFSAQAKPVKLRKRP